MRVNFLSDKVRLSGPKVDGTVSVTFEVGEYQVDNLKELLGIRDKNISVTIEVE